MVLATMNTGYVYGIDLHSRYMYICIMDQKRSIKVHRNIRNDFQFFKSLNKIDVWCSSLIRTNQCLETKPVQDRKYAGISARNQIQ